MPKLTVPYTYDVTAIPKRMRSAKRYIVLSTVDVDIREMNPGDLSTVMTVKIGDDTTPWHFLKGKGTFDFMQAGRGAVSPGMTAGLDLSAWNGDVKHLFERKGEGVTANWLRGRYNPVTAFCKVFYSACTADELPPFPRGVIHDDEDEAREHVIAQASEKLFLLDGKVYASSELVWTTRVGMGFMTVEPADVTTIDPSVMCFRLDRYEDALAYARAAWPHTRMVAAEVEYLGDKDAISFDQEARRASALRAVIDNIARIHGREIASQPMDTLISYAKLRDADLTDRDSVQPLLDDFIARIEDVPGMKGIPGTSIAGVSDLLRPLRDIPDVTGPEAASALSP